MYNKMDQAHINDTIKKSGLPISYKELSIADITSIIEKIEKFSQSNE